MAGSPAQRAMAEMVGTFLFSFLGAAAFVADERSGGALGIGGVAAVHGLALAAIVAALGPVSGAHVNPAVSVAWALAGRMRWPRAVMYVLAQLLGGVAAALAAAAVFGSDVWRRARLAVAAAQPERAAAQIILEAILTLAVTLVYFGARIGEGQRPAAALAVGAAMSAAVFLAAPLTGGTLNPARAFGVALAGSVWENHWLVWAGPLAGAVVAAVVGALLAVREARAKE